MIHDHAMMIHYAKQDQKVHIQICKFIVVQNNVASYMCWPVIVAILSGVL